ncbi:MAG: lysylphosphatidylglycerol synthase domain-containing protein [Bacteroidales bacterium]
MAFNLTLSIPQAFILLAALGLSSAIPSTPGYVGVYQIVAVAVLVPLGFRQEDALVYILAYQAFNYILVGVWGGIGVSQMPWVKNYKAM